ncbi:hypothetical protein L3X38_024895 [Prunus dulcis]|uniref:Reverse transcriptase zinc-binding domain-containing protein n=1 Tax=Prunus dulcis TaxID=3755 RepID=A0AAD4Z5U8_PRUDU|nr:hypothetical protein L3X38_024895 [Prunus dulcis]
MPASIAAKVELLMRNFLWEGVEEGRKAHLVNWERVSRNKEVGGVGIGSLREKNKALRAKWLWRFPIETNAMWHKVIKSKYGLDSNDWDSKLTVTGSCRNPWQDISKGYNTFLQCCRFSVGNGVKVRFWEDQWLKEGLLRELFPRLFSLSRKKEKCIVDFVIDAATPSNWDFGFRRNLTEAEIAEVVLHMDVLRVICLNYTKAGKRIWELEDHGLFSCKSFRAFISANSNTDVFPPFASVWKAKTPPKVKFFMWLIAIGKVNTCDRIQRRNPMMCLSPHWCVLC